MSGGRPSRRSTVAGVLVLFFLVLAGLVLTGRLAMDGWLGRPMPGEVPRITPAVLPEGVEADKPPAPFLLCIVDGLREQAAWSTEPVIMPHLKAFAAEGVWGVALTGEPTLTAPCVRALISGRRPDLLTGFRNFNAHEVGGTLIELLARRGATTAHGGDAAAFQFARRWYDGARVLQFPDQGPTDQGQCDAQSVPHVLEQIEAGATAITMHLTFPDHAGHKHGALGSHYADACRVVDGQLHDVTTAFRARHPGALVLIASDHGVSALGTHGGGEASAKRAPFALVGPGVRTGRVEIDQCSLAPTVAMLLGIAQPALADEPPLPELTTLPRDVTDAALKAYIEARLAVAVDVGVEADLVERRRARLSVETLGSERQASLATLAAEAGELGRPRGVGSELAALFLALLLPLVLVHLFDGLLVGHVVPRWAPVAAAGLFILCFDAFAPALPMPAPVLFALLLTAAAAAVRWTWAGRLRGARPTLTWLLVVPIGVGVGLTLQRAFEIGDDPSAAATRLGVAFLVGVGVALFTVRPRRLVGAARAAGLQAPAAAAAFVGGLFGFLLTLRPFIDPAFSLSHLVAALALGGLAILLVRARTVDPRVRVGVGLVGGVLLAGSRLADVHYGSRWIEHVAPRDGGWFALGLVLVALAFAAARLRGLERRDLAGLGLALLAMVGACVLRLLDADGLQARLGASGYELFSQSITLCALCALGVALYTGSHDGRFAVRLAAGAALARRLASSDGEFAAYALLLVGAALASRMALTSKRWGLAALAILLVLVRTGAFHAMGFTESFSTLDVGQAFQGLAGGTAAALDPTAPAQITHQVVLAGIQVALRMGLPWIPFVAALLRSRRRRLETEGTSGDRVDVALVLGGIALAFAARGAAVVLALPAWWRQSWWMGKGYTVYAFAAADVLLLLVAAALCGAFGARGELGGGSEGGSPGTMPV